MRILYHPARTPVNMGYLYNNPAIQGRIWGTMNYGNIANYGWHVPTESEWDSLFNYALSNGKVLGLKKAGTDHWSTNNGTDDWGWNARGAGNKADNQGGGYMFFENVKGKACYWSSTGTVHYCINDDGTYIKNPFSSTWLLAFGFTLKLIKDDSNWYEGMIYTGNDNKRYNTCKVNDQVWTVEPLRERKYRGGEYIIFSKVGYQENNSAVLKIYPSVDNNYEFLVGKTRACCNGLANPYADSLPY